MKGWDIGPAPVALQVAQAPLLLLALIVLVLVKAAPALVPESVGNNLH